MGWLGKFLSSSIGQKIIMSLTGLFLIVFLIVHLAGNLQLLKGDEGQAFNEYSYLMTHNPLIKTISYLLYAFILIHTIQGLLLMAKNRAARGSQGYEVNHVRAARTNGFIAKNMGRLGILIFVFLLVHLYQFWLGMKTGALETVNYSGQDVYDLYKPVYAAFTNLGFVLFYVVSMLVIAFHLWHGFQSAFQTLGWNHKGFGVFVRRVGKVYAILIPLGFALIPVIFYFRHAA